MSHREKRRLKIGQLPANLSDALDELEKDQTVRGALGDHILEHYLSGRSGRTTSPTFTPGSRTGIWASTRFHGPPAGRDRS